MANPTATFETSHGAITVELFADKTPQTVASFVSLATSGHYDGTKFHRVIADFMIQGGDPLTKDDSKARVWGTGGPGYTIIDEFVKADGTVTNDLPARPPLALRFTGAGILAMANTGRPKSGGSQFFITLGPTPHLDGKHTIFGKVTGGMDIVKAIGSTAVDAQDRPKTPVVVKKVAINGDVPKTQFQKFGR